jgi:hypothetical protein
LKFQNKRPALVLNLDFLWNCVIYLYDERYNKVKHYQYSQSPEKNKVQAWPFVPHNVTVHVAGYVPIVDYHNVKQSDQRRSKVVKIH